MEKRGVSRYLVVVRVGKKQPSPGRALETIKDVKEALVRCSTGEVHLAFNSEDTATVGFLLKSTRHPGGILKVLQGTDSVPPPTFENHRLTYSDPRSAAVLNDDGVFVFQLGNDSASYGFSKAQMWLDRD